ncbi:hypothetical protein PNEG_01268 [Pneumocystis murina B123]|uniref:Protein YIP n=1 Tax=Pneumocystis murina (strain B123) TaxID=1069680 RepID=M7NTF5_PNEMU|nr:hypothetical protein PNEG_01268 [Pneumocystis murina B123]EMR10562.1 hypothetical protein PNEG_01268 [Pneumocystis murina B123]
MPQSYEVIIDVDESSNNTDLNFDLEFQNFRINENISNIQENRFNTDIYQNVFAEKQTIWSIEFYSRFFNINTDQVVQRSIYALFPVNSFIDLIHESSDFYGPFWIITTVIFMIFFSSTMSERIKAHLSNVSYNYNFSTLTKACYIIYGYNIIVPICSWGLLMYYQCKPKLDEYICLYGYSMTIWIPMMIINISPFEIFHLYFFSNIIRWISTLIGFGVSGLFLLKELRSIMDHVDSRIRNLILSFILLLHAILSIAFRILFFA